MRTTTTTEDGTEACGRWYSTPALGGDDVLEEEDLALEALDAALAHVVLGLAQLDLLPQTRQYLSASDGNTAASQVPAANKASPSRVWTSS
jgi:hypothetical protein